MNAEQFEARLAELHGWVKGRSSVAAMALDLAYKAADPRGDRVPGDGDELAAVVLHHFAAIARHLLRDHPEMDHEVRHQLRRVEMLPGERAPEPARTPF